MADAVREHQEADLSFRANLPTPGKVETAKAGCGHKSGQPRGEDSWSSSQLKEDLAVTGLTRPSNLPIAELISRRSLELGIGPSEFVRRCGYKNIGKGLRRVEELCRGEFQRTRGLISGLPRALGVTGDVVSKAIDDTAKQLHKAEEAAWRASFKPHAIILTDKRVPQPIFVAAIIGASELLRIDFPPCATADTYVSLAIEGICARLARWNREFNPLMSLGSYQLPAFGRPTGFVVNYSPNHAVRFDLEGHALERLPTAHRIGQATLHINASSIASGVLPTMAARD
jgi:hypothetical protein